MSDIKSAWEIAQEKASRLGELSPEEREEKRREKFYLAGETLADKYLSQHNIEIIRDELGKYDVRDRDLVASAAVRHLAGAIDLQYPDALVAISIGIIALKESVELRETLDKIKSLSLEFLEAEEKERQDIQRAGDQIIHQLRISGSAIGGLNIHARKDWQEKLDQTIKPFNDRLRSLKQELQV